MKLITISVLFWTVYNQNLSDANSGSLRNSSVASVGSTEKESHSSAADKIKDHGYEVYLVRDPEVILVFIFLFLSIVVATLGILGQKMDDMEKKQTSSTIVNSNRKWIGLPTEGHTNPTERQGEQPSRLIDVSPNKSVIPLSPIQRKKNTTATPQLQDFSFQDIPVNQRKEDTNEQPNQPENDSNKNGEEQSSAAPTATNSQVTCITIVKVFKSLIRQKHHRVINIIYTYDSSISRVTRTILLYCTLLGTFTISILLASQGVIAFAVLLAFINSLINNWEFQLLAHLLRNQEQIYRVVAQFLILTLFIAKLNLIVFGFQNLTSSAQAKVWTIQFVISLILDLTVFEFLWIYLKHLASLLFRNRQSN